MKTLDLIIAILTGLLLFSTIVCGLWLQFSGKEITDGSRTFHMVIGLLTSISTVVALILLLRH